MTTETEIRNYIDKVSHMFLFKGIDKHTIGSYMSKEGCSIETFNQGDVIFSPDSFEKKLGLVTEGSIKAYSGDSDSLINIISENGVFGLASLFGGENTYCSKVVAGKDCKVIFFSESLIQDLLFRERAAMLNYVTFLSDRIRFLNKKIATYTADSAKSKLLRYLMNLAEQQDVSEGDVTLPISCQQLAESLNMGRASLYRAFEELENDGIAIKNGKTVKINNQ
ncbi:MAG: Crp/Fnr family transcriptional regulator [Ruminococcaceae bacterium]|nr:Crp/Fnr family transcriptional regulator [Oscillospiraceae bacterium]